MLIKGEYRDILRCAGRDIADSGWNHNDITNDYGKFLAALMKKEFKSVTGIEYLAVGKGSKDQDKFRERVRSFFDNVNRDIRNKDIPLIPPENDYWVWAKKITEGNINYVDKNNAKIGEISNKVLVEVLFKEGEPSQDMLEFEEFALLGIMEKDGKFDTQRMFLIDFMTHPPITKDKSTQLVRNITLRFP